jgi:CubicO group peptidase (beta-lactamase class C family)
MPNLRLGLAAMALLLCGAAHAGSSEDEAIYKARWEAFLKAPGQVSFTPLEPVVGAAPRRLPVRAKPAIRVDALDDAAAYAGANRSSALIVWRKGRIELARYYGDTTADSLLVSKSMAKPLTAVAVGRAIRLGMIRSLDQPIADFIPAWRGTPKEAILVRHLLDQRSGLLEQGFSPDPDHPLNRAYLDTDHGRYIVNFYPLIDTPGARYGYANVPSELVAVVIEQASGMRYGEFIGRHVLAPIGAKGGMVWVSRRGGLAHSGCCIHLPAESWLRLGLLLLDDGRAHGRRLLPQGYVAEMRKGTPQNPHFGLGIWIGSPWQPRRGFGSPGRPGPQVLHSEPYLDPDLFLFDGNSNQTLYLSPKYDLAILRMGETPPASPEWDNARLPNLIMRAIR